MFGKSIEDGTYMETCYKVLEVNHRQYLTYQNNSLSLRKNYNTQHVSLFTLVSKKLQIKCNIHLQ